jgi:hypothetical protein
MPVALAAVQGNTEGGEKAPATTPPEFFDQKIMRPKQLRSASTLSLVGA